jgi:hypothetical protein
MIDPALAAQSSVLQGGTISRVASCSRPPRGLPAWQAPSGSVRAASERERDREGSRHYHTA